MMKKRITCILFIIIISVLALSACGGESLWIVGEGAPDAGTHASVGDLYLDEGTQLVYRLTEDGWVMLAPADGKREIKCHTGTAVSGEGESVSATVEGSGVGDLYINTDTGIIYECTTAGVWKPTSALTGDSRRIKGVTSEVVSSGSSRELRVTVTYTDGTSEVTTHKTPLGIDRIAFVDDTYRALGDTTPVRIKAIYENGDAEFISVTSDMYIVDSLHSIPDFGTVGSYRCAVKYGGRAASFTVEVVNIHDSSVKSIVPEHPRLIMRVDASGALVTDELYTDFYGVLGSGRTVPLSKNDITLDFADFRSVGTGFTAYASLKSDDGVVCEFTVLPLRSVDEVPYSSLSVELSKSGTVALSREHADIPAESGLFATLSLTLAQHDYLADIPLTTSMLRELDGGQYVMSQHPPRPLTVVEGLLGAQCEDLLLLEVYDPGESSLVGLALERDCFKLGVSAIDDLELLLSLKTRYGTRYTVSTCDASIPDLDASMITEGQINFNLAGDYPVKIFYDYDADGIMDTHEVLTTRITVYNPDENNIKDVELESDFTLSMGDELDAFLEEQLLGKVARVWHFDYLGMPYTELAVTRDMLDLTDIGELVDGKFAKAGEYKLYIKISLGAQFIKTVRLTVAASADENRGYTKIYLNENSAAQSASPFTTAYLFENGTAILNPYLTPDGLTGGYASYTLSASTLYIKYLGTTLVYTMGERSDGTSGVPDGYYEVKSYIPDFPATLYTGSGSTAELNSYDAYIAGGEYITVVRKAAVAPGLDVAERVLFTVHKSGINSLGTLVIDSYDMTLTFNHGVGSESFVIN